MTTIMIAIARMPFNVGIYDWNIGLGVANKCTFIYQIYESGVLKDY